MDRNPRHTILAIGEIDDTFGTGMMPMLDKQPVVDDVHAWLRTNGISAGFEHISDYGLGDKLEAAEQEIAGTSTDKLAELFLRLINEYFMEYSMGNFTSLTFDDVVAVVVENEVRWDYQNNKPLRSLLDALATKLAETHPGLPVMIVSSERQGSCFTFRDVRTGSDVNFRTLALGHILAD